MKTSLKWLALGFFLAATGGIMMISSSTVVFYLGIGAAAVGILIIAAISFNRTGF